MHNKRVEVYKTVRLVLQKNVRLKIKGSVTGNEYVFDDAGAELDVDERDAPVMLAKRNMNPCCSGTYDSPYFIKVEGR